MNRRDRLDALEYDARRFFKVMRGAYDGDAEDVRAALVRVVHEYWRVITLELGDTTNEEWRKYYALRKMAEFHPGDPRPYDFFRT